MNLHCFAAFLLLLSSSDLLSLISGKSAGVCTSPGGRFPPFAIEGKPPRTVSKGPKDLTLCRVFRKKTCCDVSQTHPALLTIRRLASTGEASQECLQLWELLECSICDPQVGTQQGPPLVCASLCDRVYDACSDAYFSIDAKTQVLAPCGVNDFVCGRASEWISNGTDLCRAAGFSVKPTHDLQETPCYGGKASLDSIADSWRPSQRGTAKKAMRSDMWEDFQDWMKDTPFSEKVGWAVGGMVLTAGVGLLFASKRKSHSQRQKLAAIQRAARKLEAKMSPSSSPVAEAAMRRAASARSPEPQSPTSPAAARGPRKIVGR